VSALEQVQFAFAALRGHRLRSILTLMGMAIGVAAVVLLTALGEGARRYVVDQFASLGSNLLIVVPGKTETTGNTPMITGGLPRDLTLEDSPSGRRGSDIRTGAAR
jgi:putative ABC transport system permease protein